MNKIHLISTLAEDRIIYPDGKEEVRAGGPAFWIKKVFDQLGVNYDFFTAKRPAQVDVKILPNDEHGTIVSLDSIKYENYTPESLLVISTIGNEFDLNTLQKIDCQVAIDIQGYNRAVRGKKEKLKLDQRIINKIIVVKGTRNEANNLNPETYEELKKKIFLITNGSNDLTIFQNGKASILKIVPMQVSHTIGAGDTFFAAFISKYQIDKNTIEAAKFAIDSVNKFLMDKKS